MDLYHGSPYIIEKPEFGKESIHNDYGLGFYCTESPELAKEWACTTKAGGYANRYAFDMEDLRVLDLSDGSYHILNWLAILLENRVFRVSFVAEEARNYILNTFKPQYEDYDVIIGYRADDSYFTFATAFLNNTISLQKLERAMVLGKLGIQIVPKSQKAFERLKYRESIPAEGAIYYPKRLARDEGARAEFRDVRSVPAVVSEVYMLDILRERWKNDDPRLQRVVLG